MKKSPRKQDRARCLRIFRNLSAYLDGELSPAFCREIRRHMKGCGNCCAFLNTLKATVELCRRKPAPSLPPSSRKKILRRIRREAAGIR
jgi:anti-sigma factor RsiW